MQDGVKKIFSRRQSGAEQQVPSMQEKDIEFLLTLRYPSQKLFDAGWE